MSAAIKVIAGAALLAASFFIPGGFTVLGIKMLTGKFVGGLGLSVALSGVSQALVRKPANNLLHQTQGRLITARQPAAPWHIVYGQVRKGGVLTYIQTVRRDNEYLLLVITLAGHDVERIGSMYFDGEEVALTESTSTEEVFVPDNSEEGGHTEQVTVSSGIPVDPKYRDHVYVEKNLGLSGQQCFPSLIHDSDGLWTGAHRQRGRAAAYVRLRYSDTLFPKGVPNITFDVQGKRVFDPRVDSVLDITAASNAEPIQIEAVGHGRATGDIVRVVSGQGNTAMNGVWQITVLDADNYTLDGSSGNDVYTGGGKAYRVAYSNNAALVANDYLIDPKIGLPADYQTEVDETALIAGANVCDEVVNLPESLTETRYHVNGMFESTDKPGEILPQLAGAMAGWVPNIAGKWHIIPGAYRSPVMTLDEGDIIAPVKIRTQSSRRDIYNGVKGTFVSAATWQNTDFPAATGDDYLIEDNNERSWKDIHLPFTITHTAAQRIAWIDLERARRQKTVDTVFSLVAYQAQPGDVVRLSLARQGWVEKTFEVHEAQLVPQEDDAGNIALGVRLALQEVDVNVYGFAVDDYGLPLDPSLLPKVGTSVPAPPQWGLSANLAGELRLSVAVPKRTDWRSGELNLLVDDEVNRVSTEVVTQGGEELEVASSAGFLVGDLISFQREVAVILGPGLPETEPTSNTWEIGRAQKLSYAWPAIPGDLVTRLTWHELHWNIAPRWTLRHPTTINGVLDLANGPYYIKRFFVGRKRILYASLEFSGPGGTSELVERSYAEFASEPIVEGTLPGLRTSHGGTITLEVQGPLSVGEKMSAVAWLPADICLGIVSAKVEGAPVGGPCKFQMKLDGVPVGPEAEISEGATSTGTFFSGARTGNVGLRELNVDITEVGSEDPGSDLLIKAYY